LRYINEQTFVLNITVSEVFQASDVHKQKKVNANFSLLLKKKIVFQIKKFKKLKFSTKREEKFNFIK